MISVDDQLKYFSVKVNNGSGCIFQPNTDEYTYILTVKHNILYKRGKPYAKVNRYNLESGSDLIVKNIYFHPNLLIDLAIIVVDYIGKDDYHLLYSKYEKNEKVVVFGYPKKSYNQSIKTNSFNCKCDFEYEKDVSFKIISENPLYTFNSSTADNVVGFSGSGIFLIDGDSIILKGIFPQLNFPDGSFNSLIAYQIDCFQEIVNANKIHELTPEFLLNFKTFEKLAFYSLEPHISIVIEENLNKILSSSITPSKIADLYRGGLYIPYTDQYKNKLINKNLWKGWLELLTVLSIVAEEDKIADDSDLLKMYLNKINLLFSLEEPVLSIVIKNLIRDENLKNFLIDDVCIVINSAVEPSNRVYTKKGIQRILPDISRASQFDRGFKIDESVRKHSFSCLHLSHFLNKIGVADQNIEDAPFNIEHIKATIKKIMADLDE